MKTKNIYHNIYAIRYQKPKHEGILWIFTIFFFLFIFFFCFIKMKTFLTLEGIYDCQKEECIIKTILPLNEIKKLTTNREIEIQKEKIPLQIKEFGTLFEEKNRVFQNITLKVPKQDFYLKETIEFQLIEEEKSWLEICLDALKGGDTK